MVLDSPRSADIRQANAVNCIQTWRSSAEPLTIAELAQRTGLSRPTVDAVLSTLEQDGIVSELPADASGSQGGRPARRFRFEALSAVVAGIEAAPLGVTVLLADLRGRVIARTSLPTGRELPAGQRLAVVIDAVRQALAIAGLPLNRLKAACVGVSGVIGHDGKISRSYFVPEWNNADISTRLSVELGCTVFLENDIKLAAYAEHHHGASQLASSSVYFQIDRHIAFATTLNGKIHQGAHKSAGELASLRGMRWTTNTVQGEVVWKSARSLDELVELANGGNEAALLEFRTFTSEIATRVVTVSLIVDPDLIVIGGGFATNETFMNGLRAEIDRLTLLDAKPGVLASTLHGEGTLIGALALSFQECSTDLYGTAGLPVPELTIPESRLVSVAS